MINDVVIMMGLNSQLKQLESDKERKVITPSKYAETLMDIRLSCVAIVRKVGNEKELQVKQLIEKEAIASMAEEDEVEAESSDGMLKCSTCGTAVGNRFVHSDDGSYLDTYEPGIQCTNCVEKMRETFETVDGDLVYCETCGTYIPDTCLAYNIGNAERGYETGVQCEKCVKKDESETTVETQQYKVNLLEAQQNKDDDESMDFVESHEIIVQAKDRYAAGVAAVKQLFRHGHQLREGQGVVVAHIWPKEER